VIKSGYVKGRQILLLKTVRMEGKYEHGGNNMANRAISLKMN
jgi:hypothetical protein